MAGKNNFVVGVSLFIFGLAAGVYFNKQIPEQARDITLDVTVLAQQTKSNEQHQQSQRQVQVEKQKSTGASQRAKSLQPLEEQLECIAAIEAIPIYEITVKKGDSLRKFVPRAYAKVTFQIANKPYDQLVGCYFENFDAEKTETWQKSSQKETYISIDRVIAAINGMQLEPEQEDIAARVNQRLFQKGRKIRLPNFTLTHTSCQEAPYEKELPINLTKYLPKAAKPIGELLIQGIPLQPQPKQMVCRAWQQPVGEYHYSPQFVYRNF